MNPSIEVYIDGGSRGNPGPSGGGFAIYEDGRVIEKGSEFFGDKTNNQAEYMALGIALQKVYDKYGDKGTEVKCFMDSKLAVEQMSGNWKVKSLNVKPLFQKAIRIADKFESFSISHIPREENAVADYLANRAMDLGY